MPASREQKTNDMAEQQDEKSRVPVAGIFALIAMVSSFLIYQEISLQTFRPIDKETARNIVSEKGIVQSRLWQDPFEAVEAHRLKETKRLNRSGGEADSRRPLDTLVSVIVKSEVSSLRILPVFVDGSPYTSGAESRLNDRYAVVSALGAAGYVPESGDFIRFFEWSPEEKESGLKQKIASNVSQTFVIPAELFFPKAKLQNNGDQKHVLVLWLKNQDFSAKPLAFLGNLLGEFDTALDAARDEQKIKSTYEVLGPRFSTGLSAMLKEIKEALREELRKSGHLCPSPNQPFNPPFNALKDVHFYSPWATAEDTFLLDDSADPDTSKASKEIVGNLCKCAGRSPDMDSSKVSKPIVETLFICAGIKNFIRTIKTDAMLAEQLLQELKRRRVDLKPCDEKDCNPKIALISEWDTRYGRALPRTFVAVAMNGGSGETSQALEFEIDKLRRDEWPGWVSPHSYLAGLDGELPAKENDKGDGDRKDRAQPEALPWYAGSSRGSEKAGHSPEGRSQLDYVLRLATALKQEEARNGEEFEAIGVLGSDVYDKLLILQALRQNFPRAIFFTTDLNARLAFPAHWNSTHNLIIASHFGLELQPELQTPIPPFRDSYQTSLFYAALMALEHLVLFKNDSPDFVQLNTDQGKEPEPKDFFTNTGSRLYEIGRHGAFDISTDGPLEQPADYTSIHPTRPDMDSYFGTRQNLKWTGGAVVTAVLLILGIMLISSTVADAFLKLGSNMLFWLGLAAAGWVAFELVSWMPHTAESEPFVLTEGISAWPTAAIRLLALVTSLLFLWYSWRKMKDNERFLAREFDLGDKNSEIKRNLQEEASPSRSPPPGIFARAVRRCLGIHGWRPHEAGQIDAVQLWREYTTLGKLSNFFMRGVPQLTVALSFAWLIMVLFGFPNTPCRGSGCFVINDILVILSVTAMMVLIFYVIDVTRLCRRWVNCIAMKKVRWPDGTLAKIASERGINRENLDEWLGIELIAERTTVIGNFIYFPFIVMFLLGIARHSYIDNWDFPVAIVLFLTLNGIFVFVNGMALRRSAEMAKREAIKRLESKLIQLSDQTPEEIKQRQQIEWAIREIKSNRRGAFLPFTEHPVFGAAIALPSGAYGIVLLLEYFVAAF